MDKNNIADVFTASPALRDFVTNELKRDPASVVGIEAMTDVEQVEEAIQQVYKLFAIERTTFTLKFADGTYAAKTIAKQVK